MFLGVCDEILINLNPFGVYPTALIAHEKFQDPCISPKKNSSDYRVHGTQNDQLELMVLTQQSVLKNMHRAPGPEILIRMCQNPGRQTKPAYFAMFWPFHIFQNQFFR